MHTYYDLLQQIKSYGSFIYTGNKELDLHLIEEEIRTLKVNGLLSSKEFSQALLIISRERNSV